jgi:hypothetical protein
VRDAAVQSDGNGGPGSVDGMVRLEAGGRSV